MAKLPKHITEKLNHRRDVNQLRSLKDTSGLTDFSSNDYLSLARSEDLYRASHQYLKKNNLLTNGSTGSRLLSGNSVFTETVEYFIAEYHQSENALLFNSGYTANLGLFSSIPIKNNLVLYDELIHASIRDGLRLTQAKSYKFKHNSIKDLEKKLVQFKDQTLFVVIEAVYSMDGDYAEMEEVAKLCEKYNTFLIIDEAHFFGTISKEKYINYCRTIGSKTFARLVTYGKALGAHGASVLCSNETKQYLINYSRSLIYTTSMSPHSIATIRKSYDFINERPDELLQLINYFNSIVQELNLKEYFIKSTSPIQSCIIGNAVLASTIAEKMQKTGFSVLPIFSPTVPLGKERLRFCVHTHNTKQEILEVLHLLATLL